MMRSLAIAALAALGAAVALAQAPARGPLPAGKVPPGKVFMVVQPHHDDHTTDYGMGGLIARLVDEGYTGYYIRASNDEKDGPHGYPLDDMINLKECITATRILGIKDVFSFNWRNDLWRFRIQVAEAATFEARLVPVAAGGAAREGAPSRAVLTASGRLRQLFDVFVTFPSRRLPAGRPSPR